MGSIIEFPLGVRFYLHFYPWRKINPTPWTPLVKPLSQCKLALVSSAGLVMPDQPRYNEVRRNDCSFRVIPADTDVRRLVDNQPSRYYDHTGVWQDRNLVFPLERLRELVAQRRIGSLNERMLSFCGAITRPESLIRDTAPQAARWLREDGVDVAVLIPTCPMCSQAVALVAAELERQGVATVCLQLLSESAERTRPPRGLLLPFRHGYPLWAPHEPVKQHVVLNAALELLENPAESGPLLTVFDLKNLSR